MAFFVFSSLCLLALTAPHHATATTTTTTTPTPATTTAITPTTATSTTVAPMLMCPTSALPEQSNLFCWCHRPCNVTGRVFWPGYSNTSRLEVRRVLRQDDGKNYTCVMTTENNVTTSATFTLRVSYCPDNQWRCNNDQCIWEVRRCDGRDNCRDGSDEENCDCPAKKWRCDNDQCIWRDWRCDGEVHCADGSDEKNCEHWQCSATWWKCSNNRCIWQHDRCNGGDDCGDNSDEEQCEQWDCPADMWKCRDNRCVWITTRCDGTKNCADWSDEDHCYQWNCSAGMWKCNRHRCVWKSKLCDGTNNCGDNSDEVDCANCSGNAIRCNDQCISKNKICDGYIDCTDGSDEQNCGNQSRGAYTTTSNTTTTITTNSTAAPILICPTIALPQHSNFVCWCYRPWNVTGWAFLYWPEYAITNRLRVRDVLRQDDGKNYTCVMNIGNGVFTSATFTLRVSNSSCFWQAFSCSQQCISKNKRCNGRFDCTDFSDERNCAFRRG